MMKAQTKTLFKAEGIVVINCAQYSNGNSKQELMDLRKAVHVKR